MLHTPLGGSARARRIAIILIHVFILPLAVFAQPAESSKSTVTNPNLRRAQPPGALTGATVFVSPGHGWYYSDKAEKWVTQRGISHGLIEDHSNAEAVLQYLLPYLWNAGANVVPTRERDLQTNMVIIEAEDATRIGNWEREETPWAYGEAQYSAPAMDPTKLKSMPDAESRLAVARFVPDIPEAGHYAVYVWYGRSMEGDTAEKAEFNIIHTGGMTVWQQDQNRDGQTWKYIGRYYFNKGKNPDQGAVIISNATFGSDKGRVVVDAVRFGGGIGAESGKPRWEESGRYHASFMGFDEEAEMRRWGTVSAMPIYSEWESEVHETPNSIYVSWHTNAHTGEARGLFSFVYGPNSWGGLEEFAGFPGGVELVSVVHDEIINDVHAGYDPEWRNGPKVCRWLGETNPTYNNKMPAALFEMGFHDNEQDAKYILDARFRKLVARAVYQGIVKYYAENVEGFENATLAPEPPTHLRLLGTADGRVKVAWNPPPANDPKGLLGDPASGYRLYESPNGKGFDNGVPIRGTQAEIDLEPGETRYVRVTATNEGGESWPGETLAVRLNEGGPAPVLIVNGFDRLDGGLNRVFEDGHQRGILEEMNTFDYSIQHAGAIAASGYGFDSASNEAVVEGLVDLSPYKALVWILGQEDSSTGTFDESERATLEAYLDGGGALFVSGSNVVDDLGENAEARPFLETRLLATGYSTSTDVRQVVALEDGIFSGMDPFAFGDPSDSVYPVHHPDELYAARAGKHALQYEGGRYAAIAGSTPHRVIYLAFPFEAIGSTQVREELMRRALEFLISAETSRETAMLTNGME